MKKIFCVEWLVTIALGLLGVGSAFGRNIGDAYMAVYTCLTSDGTPVEGQNITLKIQKASNGYWFDFNDSAFKNESWGNKSVSLSEDTTEHQYYYSWTPPAGETAPEQYLFVYDNTNTTYKDHQIERVDYQAIGNSTFAGGAVASVTGGVGGNVTGSVGSVIGGVTVTTNNDKTGYSLTTAPPTAAEIQAELEENGASILDTLGDRLLGTIAAGTHNPQSGDAYGIVNNGTYGNSAIKGYVDDIESRLTAARAGYLDKLNVSGTLAHSDAAATYKADVSALALEATLDGIKGTTFNTSTDSLEAIRDRGDSAWITATGFSTHSAADVWAVENRSLTDKANFSLSGTQAYNNTGKWTGDIDGNVTAVTNGVTLAGSAIQAIWDALTSALDMAGSIGKLIVDNLNAAITSRMATFTLPGNFSNLNITEDGNVTSTNAGTGATAQEVWEYGNRSLTDKGNFTLSSAYDAAKTALPAGSYTAPDNAGIAAIQAKTDNLPSDPADESDLETLIDALPNNTEFAAAFTEVKGATWSSLTDTLEAIRDRGDTAWLTATGFAVPGDAMTLSAAYDAAKTASQAGDAMTLTEAYAAAKTAAQAGDTMKVSSGTGAGQVNLVDGAVALQADQAVNVTKIEGLDATDQLDTHDGNPPAASDIKTALEADGSKLDHLWEMTEDDGGVRRFTVNALEQAPTGGTAPTAVQIREEIDSNSTQLAAIATATGTTIPGLISDLNDLDLQNVRDAMKLAASAGDPAAGSIDEKLNTAQTDLDNPDQYKATVSGLATSAEITALNDVSVSDIAAALLLNPTYKIATDASGRVSVYDLAAAALAKMFTQDTGTTYSSAVAGSVVKEIADNTAAGSGDWTSSEKTEIKTILGVTGTGTPTSTPSAGALKKIYTEMSKDYDIGP